MINAFFCSLKLTAQWIGSFWLSLNEFNELVPCFSGAKPTTVTPKATAAPKAPAQKKQESSSEESSSSSEDEAPAKVGF